jgi:phosphoglycolate phosphatase
MRFSAILFDLDGTLLDTLADLGNSMNSVLASQGMPGHPLDSYKHFVGDGMINLVRRALPADRLSNDTVQTCLAAMRAEYAQHAFDATRCYRGIPALLDQCALRGLKTAIVSNKPDEMTKLLVGRLLSSWRFDAVLGAREGLARKPDPAPALEAAKIIGMPPASFLYLGDTGTDMKTAHAAGMYPVGALWGFRDCRELRENGARRLIARPLQLIDILDEAGID